MAVKANLVIDQGTTFASSIELLDQNDEAVDVTGFTATGQVRKAYSSANCVNFTTTLANGTLVISLTANQTTEIIPGRYVYDIELEDGTGTTTRILEGIVTVTPQVTRND